MIEEHPDDFFVDSREGDIVGLTHRKSGFRVHAPARALPDGFLKAAKSKRQTVLCVDLDGTLAREDGEFDPEKIEPPRDGAKDWMRKLKDAGAYLVVWTVRGDTALIESWLEEHGIPYDAVNESPVKVPGASGKLVASRYVDNRATDASGPWSEFGPGLLEFVKRQKEGDA